MTLEYAIALVVALALGLLPVLRPPPPGALLTRNRHDHQWNSADPPFHRGGVGSGQAHRRLHGQGLRRRDAPGCTASCAPSKPPSTNSAASMKPPSSAGRRYAGSLLAFSLVSLLFTYLIQRVQQWLPLNPQGLGNVAADLGWNTAVSFTTNTNWQAYTPETTMSYITQMIALATHNFFSAAAGIAVAIAFVRGFSRHSVKTLGNFWVDFTRATLYILLPLSIVAALLLLLAGRDSEPRSLHQGRPPSKAPRRPFRRVRWHRRKPSRCSAPTAAASSTPTRRTPTRTPRRSPTSCRWSSSSSSPPASPTPSARWSATRARAGLSSPR